MKTQIISPQHENYPEGVREAPRAAPWCQGRPPTLHVRGHLPDGPAVAIIGSRSASIQAFRFAQELAGHLASAGWCIVSGGAVGIDTAAHVGALDVGGQTVSVEAGGLDTPPFPPQNTELFARMRGRISLEPDGVKRQQHLFLRRNVAMVALASATIVIHARRNGGAIQAARTAGKLNRGVFFVPESPWMARRGTLDALRDGARPLWCIDDALAELAPFAVTWPRGLDEVARRVWGATGHAPTHADEITEAAGVPHGTATTALLSLMLDGHVEEGPAGHYRRARSARMRYGSSP